MLGKTAAFWPFLVHLTIQICSARMTRMSSLVVRTTCLLRREILSSLCGSIAPAGPSPGPVPSFRHKPITHRPSLGSHSSTRHRKEPLRSVHSPFVAPSLPPRGVMDTVLWSRLLPAADTCQVDRPASCFSTLLSRPVPVDQLDKHHKSPLLPCGFSICTPCLDGLENSPVPCFLHNQQTNLSFTSQPWSWCSGDSENGTEGSSARLSPVP
jgi:hypothetical protein